MADGIRAEGSSRKRQKTSRHDAGPALKRHLSDSAATSEGSSSMAQKRAHSQSHSQQTQTQPQSRGDKCHHEAALKTLHSDVSAMRDLVTCQVCHRFMYEPFQLSCGHTYCYTCLSQWLGSNRKKTCPDCRAHIHQQPTPSYIIRELVLIFVSRTQLLPDGETAEEHHKMAQEEAALVAKDKANKDNKIGGLFKGIFNRSAHGHPMPVLRDAIDGVDRCPACHWEVEDGYCNQCGLPVGEGFSDFDEDESDDDDLSDEELDEDIMPHDDMGAFGLDGGADVFGMGDDDNMDIDPAVFNAAFGGPPPFRLDRDRLNRLNAYSPINIDTDGSSDSETDDDENNSEMDDFIDDDASHTGATYDDSSDNTEVQIITSRPGARRAVSAVVISDDEGTRAAREQAISVEDSSSEDSDDDDDDDDVPVAAINRRNKHIRQPLPNRRRPITVDSEDESSSDESDGEVHQPLTNTSTARGSSPTASNSATNDDDDDEEEEEDDDDDTSTRYGSEAPSSVAGTYNRDLDSSEVDDDEEEDRWGNVAH
ncbi:zinc finger protein, C3HC4 type (RING finger) [Teratosphaeria destructans]|uniref:Zinc finger protein, C3HC4 type (RING finger) n=1 Tax=Teratosphaeria destructans TaxID=418781 RepID=A0A9W7W6R9_9PEZI|nr:zinc finger protein, C3HC4 type (RING finger) [Teratosphaeria destructans]